MSIVRALVNDPLIILTDKPTAILSSSRGHEIMRPLRTLAKEQQRSTVIVSHDQRIKDVADRVLWLKDGQFKEVVSMATDPVYGMSVEQERAVTTEWRGRTMSFCCQGGRDEFLANPERYSN